MRREIRTLSRPEQERFVRALRRMMDGAASSKYFELAGLHGWPGRTYVRAARQELAAGMLLHSSRPLHTSLTLLEPPLALGGGRARVLLVLLEEDGLLDRLLHHLSALRGERDRRWHEGATS